jgi:hypothetical protein
MHRKALRGQWAKRRDFKSRYVTDEGLFGKNTANSAVFRNTALANDALPRRAFATKSPFLTGAPAMAHNFAINDDVHPQRQGQQGRADVKERSIYTIVSCLPIEADGRPRYRIRSKADNIERVVTEEQLSRLG